MRRSIKLASEEYRVLSQAAKAAGRSLEDFLVYEALRAAKELLKGRDAVRAALVAGERSGPAKPFDFGEMMADVDSEHEAKRRRRREYFEKTAPGLKAALIRVGAADSGEDDETARRATPPGSIFDADSWPRCVVPPKTRAAKRRRRRPPLPIRR